MGASAGASGDHEFWRGSQKSQSRCDEARAMLGEIYNWFTEDLDTADLEEVKALLDELGGK
jgi:hypothetical protein